jgi:hypothetical protein
VPESSNRPTTHVYSLWTAPQQERETFLDGVDVTLTAAPPREDDRDLDRRRKAFETPVDPESLVRSVYR